LIDIAIAIPFHTLESSLAMIFCMVFDESLIELELLNT